MEGIIGRHCHAAPGTQCLDYKFWSSSCHMQDTKQHYNLMVITDIWALYKGLFALVADIYIRLV